MERHLIITKLSLVVAVAVVTAATVGVARAAAYPTHVTVQPTCGGILEPVVNFSLPDYYNGTPFASASGGEEKVAFTANLQRWDGTDWSTVDTAYPWVWAYVNGAGRIVTVDLGWWDFGVNEQALETLPWYQVQNHYMSPTYSYRQEPEGFYRLQEAFYWYSTGQEVIEYSDWCHLDAASNF